MSTRMKSLTLVVVGILALSIFLLDSAPSAKASFKSKTSSLRPTPLLPVEERVYKLDETKLPDVIKIVEVKNLQAADFPLSMEIVFKNLSARNVYGLSMWISYPDTNVQGKHLGSSAIYGEERLLLQDNRAKPDASFIAPGEKGIVKIERNSALGLINAIEKGKLPLAETYKLEIMFQVLDFGDGTGYILNKPYPVKISELQKGLNKTQRRLVNNALLKNPVPLGFGKALTSSNNIHDHELEGAPVRGVIDDILNFPLSELLKTPSEPAAFCPTYSGVEVPCCTQLPLCGNGVLTVRLFFGDPNGAPIIYSQLPDGKYCYDFGAEECATLYCWKDVIWDYCEP